FLHVANSTQFVKESEKLPQSNIFALLSELFSEIPEFSQEAGPLLDGLKQHLTLLLPSADMGWQKLTFNPRLFHKVYFSLCLVFNVTDNEDDSSSTSSDTSDGPERKDRPQIMFASFIAAILVAIWNEHELSIGSKLKDYKRIHRAEDLLTTIVLSPYFRSLSFFFLVGFWLIVKYRREGGYITHNRHRPYPVRRAEEDAEEVELRRIATARMYNEIPFRIVRAVLFRASSMLKRMPNGAKVDCGPDNK
uniref:Uncharacterized protein n=1 Tax=Caenorhabditis japonica TaxID=281687 RepID=A0A8R1HT66_CAEJA